MSAIRATLRQVGVPVWVALAAMAVMAPSLMGEFVLDDDLAVVASACVTGQLDLGLIVGRNFWCEPPGLENIVTWRPWPVMVWWLVWQLGDGSPGLFHALNVLLHGGCAALVARLAAVLLPEHARGAALVAGLWFAVMPIHADAVASVVGVAEIWALLFGLVAMLLALGWSRGERGWLRLIGMGTAMFLALLSKESAVVFLAIVPLCALWRPDAPTRGWLAAVLVVGLGAGYLAARTAALGSFTGSAHIEAIDNPLVAHTWVMRVPMAAELLGRYLRVAVLGQPLSADYSAHAIPVVGFGPGVVVGALALAALLAAALWQRRHPGLRLAMLWLLAGLALLSNVLVLLPAMFAERLFYAPSAALCIVAAWLLCQLHLGQRRRLVAVGWLYLVVQAGLAALHAHAWTTRERITSITVANSPESARAHLWRAKMIGRLHGDPTAMEAHARQAIAILPELAAPHAVLGISLDLQGRTQEALAALQRAYALAPHEPEGVNLFVQFLLRHGLVPQARQIYAGHARARGGTAHPTVKVPPGAAQP